MSVITNGDLGTFFFLLSVSRERCYRSLVCLSACLTHTRRVTHQNLVATASNRLLCTRESTILLLFYHVNFTTWSACAGKFYDIVLTRGYDTSCDFLLIILMIKNERSFFDRRLIILDKVQYHIQILYAHY